MLEHFAACVVHNLVALHVGAIADYNFAGYLKI